MRRKLLHLATMASLGLAGAGTGALCGQGSVDDLACKVVATDVSLPGSVLFDVEVRNAAGRTAEPAIFSVQIGKPPELHRLERFPLPYSGRCGHGVAAHGLGRYHLQIASTAEPTTLAVEVVAATFRDGEPTPCPVQVGDLRQGSIAVAGRDIAATFVDLHSTAGLPVDVVLLATFEQPHQGRALLTVRLRPRHLGEVDFARQPQELGWTADLHANEGARLQRVEVVDWTTHDPAALGDPALADALLQGYERWLCWDEPWPSGSGTLHAVYSRTSRNDGTPVAIDGRFQLKDIAPPLIDWDGRLDLEPTQALERAVDDAFADLRRSQRAAFARANKIVLHDRDRFLVDGPGWQGQFGKLVDLRDGRITGLADAASPGRNWETWLLQTFGDRWLVVGRDATQLAVGRQPSRVERCVYTQQGRWIVPAVYRLETTQGRFAESIALEIGCGELRQRGEPAANGPAGPGAAALQQAWETGYRYPASATPLRARFDVATSGDATWLGQKRVRGRLTIAAFAGWLPDGPPPAVDIDGKDLDPRTQQLLGAGIAHRLRLWACRDFAARPPFAAAARGATVLADPARPGVFKLGATSPAGAALDEVEVQGGRIVRLHWRNGREQRITWQKVGDVMVPARIATGDEVLTAVWKRVGDWQVPAELRFEHAFGEAPAETLRLTDIATK